MTRLATLITLLAFGGTAEFSAQAQSPSAALDQSFAVGSGAGFSVDDIFWPQVQTVAVQADGKVLAGGQSLFTNFNGTPIRALCRINVDGSLDTGFVANLGTGPTVTANGKAGEINRILIQPDGKILICGDFDTVNGLSRSRVARLNTDGSVDTSFLASGGGVGGTTLRYLQDIALQPDGKILIGGGFNNYLGTSRISLARLNADGTLDGTFAHGVPYTVNSAVVLSLGVQADGKVLVGGSFTNWGGLTTPGIVRLSSEGALDTTFVPTHRINFPSVQTLLPTADGKVLIGGFIEGTATNTTRFFARLNADGSLDSSFPVGPNGWVSDIQPWPGGGYLVSGRFRAVSGAPRAELALIDAEGNVDPNFAPEPYPIPAQDLVHIYSSAVAPDGKIVIGGWFTNYPNNTKLNGQDYSGIGRLIGGFTGGAGKVQFTASSLVINESIGSATLSVTRMGGAGGAASVNFATSAGSAQAGSDFTATSGTLSWADGEFGAKTITVPITQDALAESSETLTVALSSPTGATIGANGTVTVTIKDDDSAPTITRHPQDTSVYVTFSASFSVGVDSALPVTYQWLSNNVPIVGATGPSLILANVQSSFAAAYSVQVSNAIGATISSAGTLNVVIPAGLPNSQFVTPGTGLNGDIYDLRFQADGKLIGVGAFNQYGGTNLPANIIRLNSDGSRDTSFPAAATGAAGSSAIIQSITPTPDGKWIITGNFTQYNGTNRTRVARLNADGSLDAGFVTTVSASTVYVSVPLEDGKVLLGDATFVRRVLPSGTNDNTFTNATLSGQVYAMVTLPDGKILASTHRTSAPSGSELVRLNADGTRDFSYTGPGRFSGGQIMKMSRLQDGRIFVSGGFTGIASDTSTNSLPYAAMLMATGELDSSFAPQAADGSVISHLVQPDGRIILAGAFTTWNGTLAGRYVRLLPDGTIDPTFITGSGANNFVRAIAMDGNGRYAIGGNFTQVNQLQRGRIALLTEGAGTVQLTAGSQTVTEQSGTVTVSLERVAGSRGAASVNYATVPGTATAATDFTAATGTLSWNDGESGVKSVVITLNNDAVVEEDETFEVVLSNPVGLPFGLVTNQVITILDNESVPRITQQPLSLTRPEDVSATFSVTGYSALPFTYQWRSNGVAIVNATNPVLTLLNVQSNFAAAYSVRLSNANGFVDSSNAVLTVIASPTRRDSTFAPATAFNGAVRAILPLGDGRALIGGEFTQPRNRIALVNSNGAVDLSFTNTATGAGSPAVYDIERDPQGRWLIAGSFSQFGGVTASNFVRLNADYTVDTNFLVALGKAPDGLVRDVTIGPDGMIWIAGDFKTVGGPYGLSYMARLNDDGTPDLSFFPRSNGSVYRVAPLADGKALIAGSFSSYQNSGGSPKRINADGSLDSTFFVNISGGSALDIIMLPDGGFYLAGSFTSPSSRIAKFDAAGRPDTMFLGGAVGNSQVNSIALQANGRLIGVGSFTNFGIHNFRFTRVETNGLQDTSIFTGTGFNQDAYKVAMEPNGAIWVGGSFTQYKGVSAPYLVRLIGEEQGVTIATEPFDRVVPPGGNTTFSVTAFGAGLTYLWFKDGVPLADGGAIAGVTTPTLTLSGVSTSDNGMYSVVVSDDRGNVAISRGAFLSVVGLPEFITQPHSASVPVGGRIFLSAQVEGAAPLQFQWYKDGVATGGNSIHLLITNATVASIGNYELVVGNSFGSVTSAVAAVQVQTSPAGATSGFFPDAGVYNTFDTIYALQPLPSGELMVGGSFGTLKTNGANQVYRQNLALFTGSGMVGPFDPALASGQVSDIVRQKDGKILVAGYFTGVSNGIVNRRYLARFNSDLTFDSSFHAALGTGPDQAVFDVAVQPDGKILIVGQFTNVSGKNGTRGVARLNPDGSVDTSFTSLVANFGNASLVESLPDGRILLVSNGSYGGHSASIYRLSSYGDVDFTFTNALGGGITALAVQTNGQVIVAGTFATPHGVNRPLLARLTSSGALDTTFLAGVTNVSALNQAIIRTVAIQENGKILAGGTFLTFGPFRNGLARINLDGTPDETFVFQQGIGDDYNADINKIALFADGRIAIGGRFATWEGVAENSLAILNGDPVLLGFAAEPVDRFVLPNTTVQFSAQAVGTPTITYQWFRGATALSDGGNVSGATTPTLTVANTSSADVGLYRLRIANGSGERFSLPAELFILGEPVFRLQPTGGTYYISNSVSLRAEVLGVTPITYQWFLNETNLLLNATNNSLAFTNLSLTNAGSYTVVASNAIGVATSSVATVTVLVPPAVLSAAFPHPAGANGTVNTIAPLGDGRVVIGGQFSAAGLNGNQTARANIALLNTNGTVDAAFNPAPNSAVEVIVRHNSGYLVGGSFTAIGGQTRANFARLNSDGTLDATFLANLGTGPAGNVTSVVLQQNGKILVGGTFNAVSGQSYPGVVRLNADGTIDSSFRMAASAFPNVFSVSLLGDGRVYVGGSFTISNRQNVVRLNANGSVDLSFTATADSQVLTLKALNDGGVLMGGYFQTVNGSSAPSMARLTAAGAVDSSWPGVKPNSSVERMLFQENGKLLVAGSFSMVGSTARSRIARYNADGSLDLSFAPGNGFFNTPKAFALEANGGVWVGGGFTSYNGTPVNNLVLLTGDPIEPPSLTPFESWAESFGLTPANSGPGVDADGDGVSNVFEYYLGTNPNDAASNPSSALARRTPQATALANVAGQFYPVMSFIRSKNAPGVAAVAQASADLTFSNPIPTVEHSVTDLGDGTERVLIRSTVPVSTQSVQFMRLQLTVQ